MHSTTPQRLGGTSPLPEQPPTADGARPPAPSDSLPVTRSLSLAYGASLLVAAFVAVASIGGLTWGGGDPYAGASSVLVSRGADAANLLVVLPILLGSMWLAGRGSLVGLLLWPGALLYALYAYVPFLVSAPFTALLFVHVALVTLSAFTLIGLVASTDGARVRARLARTPARGVGGALVALALLAYAGLAANAASTLAEAGWRGQWVADWVVGTPVLLLGGALAWLREPLGYVAAAGLLLVSGLGGVVFAVAAALDNLLAGPRTEPTVIAVHLAISAISLALLVVFLRGARPGFGASASRLASAG